VHHGAGAPTLLDSGERAARDGAIAAMLVVRPDGFIGLRADADHRRAVRRYAALVLGCSVP
jgi:hypothetical protein